MQDRVLADGTFVPAGSIQLQEPATRRSGAPVDLPPQARTSQSTHKDSNAVDTSVVDRPAATDASSQNADSRPSTSGREVPASVVRRRNPILPPTAPQLDPVSDAQLNQLVDFLQSHRQVALPAKHSSLVPSCRVSLTTVFHPLVLLFCVAFCRASPAAFCITNSAPCLA